MILEKLFMSLVKQIVVLDGFIMVEMVFNQFDEFSGGLVFFRLLDLGLIELEVVVVIRLVYFVDSLQFFLVLECVLYLQKEIKIMFKFFFEFLNFIDFVIQGIDRIILVKLKRVVGGEEVFGIRDVGDGENLVKYVVEVLIVKMGGMDDLDNVDDEFVFGMMFSMGVVIVVGEIFLWFLCEGDSGISMLFRIMMVKVLVLVL